MAKKIYIGKLSNKITGQQLHDLFSKTGRVISANVVNVTSFKENMNYGYITMSTDEETKKAINTLNNTILEGCRIKVMEAHFLDQDKQQSYYWKKRRF